ncbi:hypothetical protein GCM10007320_22290 [Pseudorhodoferax aquiterrae]|uniref:Uncharacterized protein n=1 Tax=Pseudorhodoferax aquiterrae TaxID=747304 RepID=A0ABQ3G1B2_9BURK|nr:hypothetical protein [Pseudorhodoferax aquiterrae]GHC80539.1 hypothetical protein GCM10007320_22290 [Pseudorhodoferax aquiterrae]
MAEDAAPALPQGRFAGRAQFHQWLCAGLQAAARAGWAELILADADFADWPLGERAVVAELQAWARPGRRCTLLAGSYEELRRRHARFVQWRMQWDHLISCRACRAMDRQDFPSALWSPHWSLRRLDTVHCTGWAGPEAARRVQTQELLAEALRRSTPAFAASVLGL